MNAEKDAQINKLKKEKVVLSEKELDLFVWLLEKGMYDLDWVYLDGDDFPPVAQIHNEYGIWEYEQDQLEEELNTVITKKEGDGWTIKILTDCVKLAKENT